MLVVRQSLKLKSDLGSWYCLLQKDIFSETLKLNMLMKKMIDAGTQTWQHGSITDAQATVSLYLYGLDGLGKSPCSKVTGERCF